MDNQYKNKNSLSKLEKITSFDQAFESKELDEKKLLNPEKQLDKSSQETKEKVILSSQTTPTENDVLIKEQVLEKEVENILSEGLTDLFQSLDQANKMIFKQKGEITASTIAVMLKSVKFKIYEILNLIRNWLFIIPGINKFFLEQEAKIKTDKILQLEAKNKNFKL